MSRVDLVAAGPISPREAEVLAAVGEHLTNAEIAARFFISVRTVESHVSSLLRKLGAADRRAVSERVADGVWYVDLVPVTDAAMLAPTVAAALGLGEQAGRTAEDTLIQWAA